MNSPEVVFQIASNWTNMIKVLPDFSAMSCESDIVVAVGEASNGEMGRGKLLVVKDEEGKEPSGTLSKLKLNDVTSENWI